MSSAPSVNQMRFFSASALANAPKLRLAASCSAADAMVRSVPPACALFGRLRYRPQNLHRATGLLDGRDRRLRCAGHFQRNIRRNLAVAEDAHTVQRPADKPGLLEYRRRDRRLAVKLARVDRLLDCADAYFIEALGEYVVETALRQPPMQRHLPAFEALYGDAGAGLLALDAAPGSLALAGTDTAADTHPILGGAGLVGQFMQFHRSSPKTARATLRRRRARDASPWQSCPAQTACP